MVRQTSKSWAQTNSVKVSGRLEKDVYPWLGSDPVTGITGPKILETLRRVEQRGSVESAHRVRQCINSIFRYAIDTHRLKANPRPHSDALERPQRGKFASITDPKGVGGLIRALSSYHGSLVTKIALQLAPLVFVRPGELRAAEWTEFDLEVAEWRIPAARMKGRVSHVVPLSRQAIALLKEIHPLTGPGRFVFPSERGRQRPMSANTLNAALRTLGYARGQMTTHGFRTMASTMLNESGKWRHDAIERQLAHAERDAVRAAYNAAEYLPERKRMMQWWGDQLDALSNSGEKIINFKSGFVA